MADTSEMIRLIRHAADRLGTENGNVTNSFERLMRELGGFSDHDARLRYTGHYRSLVAAMVQAETVLRMVAACMDDEPAPAPGTEPLTDQENR